MPRVNVNGVTLAYEILGNVPPVVWTPGAWWPRNDWCYLYAGRFAPRYSAVLWDRRNTGASDIGVVDAPSEFHLWTDDLHQLLTALDLAPAYIAGISAGHIFALLMAHRYPQDVKGLILLNTPTDAAGMLAPLMDAHYFQPARVARSGGMQAVIEQSQQAWLRLILGQSETENFDWRLIWIAETIAANPDNERRLLAMDPEGFATVLEEWGNWCLARSHFSGLTDDQIRAIGVPALVAHGYDEAHPRRTAEALQRLLPDAEWVEYAERWSQAELAQAQAADAVYRSQAVLTMPFIEDFLAWVEGH